MRPDWSSLRDGSWLTRAVLRAVAVSLLLLYVSSWIWLLRGSGHLDPAGRPVGSDFSFFYGASQALRHGATVSSFYTPESFNRMIGAFTGGWTYVWFYPPTIMLLIFPLAAMSYGHALTIWVLAGILAYLAATRAILPERGAVVAALLFPGVYVASIHGQNSLLLAAMIGGGLALLPRAPSMAGLLLAAASFKPQFGILLPLALLAGRRWRAFVVATLATIAIAVLAGTVFGFESWAAFLQVHRLAGSLLETQGVPYFKLGSAFSAVRLAGGTLPLAWVVQGSLAIASAAWVTFLWRRGADLDVAAAGTVVGTLLAIPYFYDYDLPLLGVALAFWVRAARVSGWLPWERSLVFALWMLPLVARPVAHSTGVAVTAPLLVVAALVLSQRSRRVARELARDEVPPAPLPAHW